MDDGAIHAQVRLGPTITDIHGQPWGHFCSHTAPEYKDIFPPMPWIVRKVVIPYVFAKRYSGYVLLCLCFMGMY